MDTLTLPGTVLGTAGYLSPEQARGEPATPASDRYALAVVAFELLTGRRPYAAETPVTEAFGHLNAEIPSAEQIAPDLPVGIDSVFSRALAKDPAERPASATELVQELRDAFEYPVPATLILSEPTPVRVHRHSQRRRNVAFTAITGALAVAGIGVAALVGVGSDGDGTRAGATRNTTSSTTTTTSAPESAAHTSLAEGAALDEQGFARMQAGDYSGALPLLYRAVLALTGSGTPDEAYASYNLAYTRFALGRCDGVLALLDRSERIQGEREAIDELRARAEERCGGSEGHGKGKGKGHGKGDGG
jgi:hypothetical protein